MIMITNRKAFTLIELIIVIAIIALLATAVFVAVNPARRIGKANDAQRWQDVAAIADAIKLYAADNQGSYPPDLGAGNTGQVELYGTACITMDCTDKLVALGVTDLDVLVDGGYMVQLPPDPGGTIGISGNCTGYWVSRSVTDIIQVGSCEHYGDTVIVVTR